MIEPDLLGDTTEVRTGARLSDDEVYRYVLWRDWRDPETTDIARAQQRVMTFVMLNPSTADHTLNDATTRKCIHYARREGFGAVVLLNLYAYRARNPKRLLAFGLEHGEDAIVGPDNRYWLRAHLTAARQTGSPIVVGWGAHLLGQEATRAGLGDLLGMFGVRTHALHVTKSGAPGHPLYLPNDAPLVEWEPTG